MMTRKEYMKLALEAYNSGKVDEYTYDAMVLNADVFSEEDKDEE